MPPKGLNPLLKRFTAGWDTISLNYPNHGFDSLYKTSRGLSEQLKMIRPSYDHITWIGHSMGGLLPWAYNLQRYFDAFVSLGTPWNGSALAIMAPWSESATEMRVGSEHLPILKKTAEDFLGFNKLSITGAWDFVVPNNPHIARADTVEIPRCTHAGLLYNERTYQEIWAFLTYKVFEEVGHNNDTGF